MTAQQTLHASLYRDPSVYDLERERIFRESWLLLTHESRIARPTEAVAVEVAGYPLVLWRQKDGSILGFHNVCPHRAGPLLYAGQTAPCTVLRCRYHGWQFDRSGALHRAPDFRGDTGDARLVPIHVATWRGYVFGYLGDEPPDLHDELAPFAADAAEARLDGVEFGEIVTHDLRCNWKTYAENYLEGFHIPYVHPSLAKEFDARRYVVTAGVRHAIHDVPSREGQTSPSEGFWAFLWPNVAFNTYTGGLNIERILPMGPHGTRIEYTFLFEPGCPEGTRADILRWSYEVTREDVTICEAVQRNLDAGVYERGVLSPVHECGVSGFQSLIRRALDNP